ncbi:MAG: response regulator [Planctomycetes bacterium]|nr:response regulator [Planctomycetota bacterium]
MKTEDATLLMIAEDDLDDQLILRQALTDSGFRGEMEFCSDGRQLLTRLRDPARRLPGLVLLDLKMPRMGGLEVLVQMRRDSRLSNMPVVAFTSSELPRDVQEAYRHGVNGYVRKPGSLTELREAIRALKHFWLDVATLPNHSVA